jgi:hypothetical protein
MAVAVLGAYFASNSIIGACSWDPVFVCTCSMNVWHSGWYVYVCVINMWVHVCMYVFADTSACARLNFVCMHAGGTLLQINGHFFDTGTMQGRLVSTSGSHTVSVPCSRVNVSSSQCITPPLTADYVGVYSLRVSVDTLKESEIR